MPGLSQSEQHPSSASHCVPLSGGRDDAFDHDFVNHGGLACVMQFFARSIERSANAANCRVIENAYGNKPKNR
jgi:hypothetical protein